MSPDYRRHACTRCAADPQPVNFGNPRKCAFEADGAFTDDNWNCATIDALVEWAEGSRPAWTGNRRPCRLAEIDGDDESMQVIGLEYGGWIVLTRYKHRGKTSSAIHVGDFWPARLVTLQLVENWIARYLQGGRKMGMTRRGFLGTVGLALGVVALPADFITEALAPPLAGRPMDGWITLVRPSEIPGFTITRDVIQQMADNFTKPLAVTVDFRAEVPVGWLTQVRLAGDTLEAKLEFPSFNRALVKEYQAIVPAFVVPRRHSGAAAPARLVSAALTNTPAVPDTDNLSEYTMGRYAHDNGLPPGAKTR